VDDDANAITPQSEYTEATTAPAYGGGWDAEPNGVPHNFHFTSEIRFGFLYDSGGSYEVDILGDDDVWVFVNGTLAIDLGGIHTPVGGSITIDSSNAASFGLTSGSMAEVAIFHAERQTTGSTFRLTLSGFTGGTTGCAPIP
jgi:fibro-slime domain-containing protein